MLGNLSRWKGCCVTSITQMTWKFTTFIQALPHVLHRKHTECHTGKELQDLQSCHPTFPWPSK